MFDSLKRLSEQDRRDVTVERVLAAMWRRFVAIPDNIYYYWPWGFPAQNRMKLASINNKYKEKRCFVIANGPSLNKIDFSLLKDEYTFGMNRVYLMKEQNGFMPTFIACIDEERIIRPFHEDLDNLGVPSFFPFSCRKYFSKRGNQYFTPRNFSSVFQTDATKPLGSGRTVTYNVIQLAFCMGFQEVYIIGKDHSFNTTEKAGKGIEIKDKDDNHFVNNYLLPGQKFDVPDLKSEEYAYKLSREAFEKAGRIIKNATVGGKLEIFERVDFYSLFPQKNI